MFHGRTMDSLIVVMASLGLVLCLGGLIGVWIMRPRITNDLNNVIGSAEQIFDLTERSAGRAFVAIAAAKVSLDEIEARMANLELNSQERFRDQIQAILVVRLNPTVLVLRNTFASVEDAGIAANNAIDNLNRLPGVDIPFLDFDLDETRDRIENFQERGEELRLYLSNDNIDRERVTTAVEASAMQLQSLGETLQSITDQLTGVRSSVAMIRNTLAGVIGWISFVVSAVLLLYGVGQIVLLKIGLASFSQADNHTDLVTMEP